MEITLKQHGGLDEIIQARDRKVKEMFAVEDTKYGKPIPVSHICDKPEAKNTDNETEIKPRPIHSVPVAPSIPDFGVLPKSNEATIPDTTNRSFDDDQFYIMINEIIKGKQ